jgi:hypothetical protein
MDDLFWIVFWVWVLGALAVAYLAREEGLNRWVYLFLGLMGTPALSLLAFAIFDGFRVAQENKKK